MRIFIALILFVNILAVRSLECFCCNARVEGRIAAFIPDSERFRDIYGTVGPSYQIEITWPTCGCWMGWVNASYFCKDGESDPLKDDTSIRIIPLSGGIKYAWHFSKCTEAYIGAGPSYSWVRIRDDSSFVKTEIDKQVWGGVFKSGLSRSWGWFYTSIFFDYQWHYAKEQQCRSIGGPLFGGSIGGEF